mmetsp:Transcript_42165/g.68299  ORF Transcript_42165/g.68299 Transcript_42165/m.68299 type:complete len:181 (-) Transcript_42165:58-600(-)
MVGWIFQIAWYQIGTNVEHVFYVIELMITTALVTNLFQYGWWRCRERKGTLTHWQRWDGAYYMGAAVPLSLAMPLAVVIIYIGQAGYPGSKMWHSGSWFPNTPHGIVLYFFKWLGAACLTIGIFKVTQLHRKLAARWRTLRGTQSEVHKVEEGTRTQKDEEVRPYVTVGAEAVSPKQLGR